MQIRDIDKKPQQPNGGSVGPHNPMVDPLVLTTQWWIHWSSQPNGGSVGPHNPMVDPLVLTTQWWIHWSSQPNGGSIGPHNPMVDPLVRAFSLKKILNLDPQILDNYFYMSRFR